MKAALPLAAIPLMALSACDNPKPRPGAAAAAAQASAPTVTPPASVGLKARPEAAMFSLDLINEAPDPRSKAGVIRGGVPVTFAGWAYDPVGKTAAKAVDIVIDGVAYGARYRQPRADVASYFKNENLTETGFAATLPASAVVRGAHTVVIRVVAADGAGYFDGAPIDFQVR